MTTKSKWILSGVVTLFLTILVLSIWILFPFCELLMTMASQQLAADTMSEQLLGTKKPVGFEAYQGKTIMLGTAPVQCLVFNTNQEINRSVWLYETKLSDDDYSSLSFKDPEQVKDLIQQKFLPMISNDQLQVTHVNTLMIDNKPYPVLEGILHISPEGPPLGAKQRQGLFTILQYPHHRVVFLYAVYWPSGQSDKFLYETHWPTNQVAEGIAQTKSNLENLINHTTLKNSLMFPADF